MIVNYLIATIYILLISSVIATIIKANNNKKAHFYSLPRVKCAFTFVATTYLWLPILYIINYIT